MISVALFGATAAIQAAESTLKPLMTEPGTVLVEEKFAPTIPKTWRGNIGKWNIDDYALRGLEIKEQKHQAVLRRPLAFRNAIISFSFRLDQSRQISLSINDAKEHVCRLIINPRGFTVQKDDHDHDGPDQAVVFAKIAMPISAGEWHHALVEIYGGEMVAQIDSAVHVGFGAHQLLEQPKANFGFTVAGGPAEFRDVKVWEAKPRADWAETRKSLSVAK